MTKSISEALAEGTQTLANAGVPEPRREATTLLAHILNRDRTYLIARNEELLLENSLELFRASVERRASGEPSQYVTGSQDFYGRSFLVTPDVLIPRPETELLVEVVCKYIGQSQSRLSICDVGTGSGCIIITLVLELDDVTGIGLDISPQAIQVARQNAQAHNVTDTVSFLLSDCLAALPPNTSFDVIVSNPPYVSAAAVPGLQREVRDHEPLVALSPGPDGLAIIRRLVQGAPNYLKPDGLLVMEIGFDQGAAIEALVDTNVWDWLEMAPDLSGIPRIVVLKKTMSDKL